MTKKEIIEYLKNTFTNRELKAPIAVRCPNCKVIGCEFCNDGWIVPRRFLKENDNE